MKIITTLTRTLAVMLASLTAGMSAESSATRRVAIVIDDGPVIEQTTKMLAVLAAGKAHVTFSYVGKNVIANPELARAALAAGHEIANHSYMHPHLKTLDDATVEKELRDTNAAIQQATGRTPVWFWAPFLESDERIERIAGTNNLTHFPYKKFHFVSTDDWNVNATDAATILHRATTEIQDKTVILCHEWRLETLQQLPAILAELRSQGFEFLTFSELAGVGP
ncbi:MAG: polysaccharide deacetylase family protein [Opitutus sp.]